MNNDETFLGLLSSQRKLLAQISEEGRRAAADQNDIPAGFGGGFPARGGLDQQHFHSFVAPNHSICETPLNEGLVLAKRFSLGLGNDMMQVPPPFPGDDQTKAGLSLGFDSLGYDGLLVGDQSSSYNRKREKDDFTFDDYLVAKRRRFSGTGLQFLDDLPLSQFQENAQRRLSMSSLVADRLQMPNFSDGLAEGEDLMHTFDTTSLEFAQPQRFKSFPLSLPPTSAQRRYAPILDPIVTREMMVSLADVMEKSQKSQQDIHDWDKKMGLKRSHSKTMRLSMRSRKKLRAMLKKKINKLAPKKR